MNISIFGMGYVGCIIGAGHSSMGYKVIGVDVNPEKIKIINSGKSPVMEKDIDRYISESVKNGLLEATSDSEYAVNNSEISLVAVGTPSKEDGAIDLKYTEKVCWQIAVALKQKNDYHLIVFKSTLFPGVVEKQLIPLIEEVSGKKAGKHFGVCHNPEFLREGSGMRDFFHPPSIVIGQLDNKSGDLLQEIYKGVDSPIIKTNIKIGEMIKYVNNSFHALKIAFANEVGNIAKHLGIDSHKLMSIFCMDKDLNISSKYLIPGVPYGGSCLTKDPDALVVEAEKMNLKTPILSSLRKSNEAHIKHCADVIMSSGKKNIGILGLSFKEGTDDLRSSAMIHIIEHLLDNDIKIRVYDENVMSTQKFGVNKKILEENFPFLLDMFEKSIENVVKKSDVIVIKNKDPEFNKIPLIVGKNQIVVDMVRQFRKQEIKGKYIGLSW